MWSTSVLEVPSFPSCGLYWQGWHCHTGTGIFCSSLHHYLHYIDHHYHLLMTKLPLSHWHRYLLLHFHAGHVIIIIFYWQGWYDHTGTGHYAHHRSDQYYHSGHVTDDHHCHHHYHHKLATCNIRLTLTGHCPLTGLIFGINMPFFWSIPLKFQHLYEEPDNHQTWASCFRLPKLGADWLESATMRLPCLSQLSPGINHQSPTRYHQVSFTNH